MRVKTRTTRKQQIIINFTGYYLTLGTLGTLGTLTLRNMGLPYDRTGKNIFEKVPNYNINESQFKDHLYSFLESKDFFELQKENGSINFTTKNSLFKIPYQITLTPELKSNINISYKIKLDFLLKVTIIVAIVGAFFAKLSIQEFLFFEFVLISVFFIINLFLIDFSIKKIITDFANNTPYIVKDESDPETMSWTNDSSRCPACGEPITETDSQCPACKLNLPLQKKGFKRYDPNEYKKPMLKPESKLEPKPPGINYTYIEKDKKG